jgi:hypothetical protein
VLPLIEAEPPRKEETQKLDEIGVYEEDGEPVKKALATGLTTSRYSTRNRPTADVLYQQE